MKYFKYILIIVGIMILAFFGVSLTFGVLNTDLYGRLTETIPIKGAYTSKSKADTIPSVMLVLYKYMGDENAIECSLMLNYNIKALFSHYKTDSIEFLLKPVDGYSYNPFGVDKSFVFKDTKHNKNYGDLYRGYESERFVLPIAPSLNGYPFDKIKIRPIIYLYINGVVSEFNLSVQKRIPGRILDQSENDKEVIKLIRTATEKWFVITSSILFLILTAILTFSLVKNKSGLSKIEELIAVAGYILATAGFREIIGVSRSSGVSVLEIVVILIPLFAVSIALFFSFRRGVK